MSSPIWRKVGKITAVFAAAAMLAGSSQAFAAPPHHGPRHGGPGIHRAGPGPHTPPPPKPAPRPPRPTPPPPPPPPSPHHHHGTSDVVAGAVIGAVIGSVVGNVIN